MFFLYEPLYSNFMFLLILNDTVSKSFKIGIEIGGELEV